MTSWTSIHWGMLSAESMLGMQACIFIVGVSWNCNWVFHWSWKCYRNSAHTVGGSQWGVMAASHGHSWQRQSSKCFVRDTHKVMTAPLPSCLQIVVVEISLQFHRYVSDTQKVMITIFLAMFFLGWHKLTMFFWLPSLSWSSPLMVIVGY